MKLVEIKNIKAKPLHEAYRTPIKSLDDLKALLNKHCGDALKTFSTPIVRGMRDGGGEYFVLRGEDGQRRSRNTSNYYTEIIDASTPNNWPKRNASIIVASFPNKSHAMEYGELFTVFPMDNVPVCVIPTSDMFAMKVTLGGETHYTYQWNDKFAELGINDSSFDRIVSDLEHVRREFGDDAPEWLQNMGDDIDGELSEAYTEQLGITDSGDPWYNEAKHEVYIGGSCVLIEWSVYEQLLADTSWMGL